MEKELTYDEAMKRAEALIAQLEQSEAISVDEYKRAAAEATALLNRCKQEIENLSEQLQAH